MKTLLKLCLLSFMLVSNLLAQDGIKVIEEKKEETRPLLYPFDVMIGGQKAVMQKGNMLFAVIEKPVKADAFLEIAKEAPMLILNAFAVKESGAVMEPGAQPAVLFVKETNMVKLTETMDKKPLKPGRYLVNVVANGATSRVVFLVDGRKEDLKIPSVKQVFDFMTK